MKNWLLVVASLFPVAAMAEVAPAEAPVWSPLLMLGIFVVIFYLMVWRPQSKRTKEHKELIGTLAKGDEVMTTGGICGKVVRVTDYFVVVEVAEKVELKFQKPSVNATLPKGTLKGI